MPGSSGVARRFARSSGVSDFTYAGVPPSTVAADADDVVVAAGAAGFAGRGVSANAKIATKSDAATNQYFFNIQTPKRKMVEIRRNRPDPVRLGGRRTNPPRRSPNRRPVRIRSTSPQVTPRTALRSGTNREAA